jgi:hypothetical protein
MSKTRTTLRRILIGCLLMVSAVFANVSHEPSGEAESAASFETRCGWFSNPTPANTWLYDKDGEWTIGVQGGYQVEGDWDWPKFKPRQWVHTNGADYGYGCACFQLTVNPKTHEVVEIKSSRALPLAACRKDQGLKKWRRTFK